MKPDPYVIGVDIGGTSVRAAAISSRGKLSGRVKRPTGAADGYASVVKNIRSAIAGVAAKKKRPPAVCAIASAGAIDASRSIVIRSPNFPDWKNVALANDGGAGLSCPVILENDANAAAVGEGWLGAAQGWSDYAAFTLGTGVGGGIVLRGELWRGPAGMAGELGHITVRPGGRLCGCGNRGCVEMYASATGVAMTAREKFDEPAAAWLRTASRGDAERVGAKLVATGAARGDRLCRVILRDAGRDLGAAIASIVVTMDITRFVIGGGMAPAFTFMKPAMRQTALSAAYTLTGASLKAVTARLGDNAGIFGAAKLAWDSIG